VWETTVDPSYLKRGVSANIAIIEKVLDDEAVSMRGAAYVHGGLHAVNEGGRTSLASERPLPMDNESIFVVRVLRQGGCCDGTTRYVNNFKALRGVALVLHPHTVVARELAAGTNRVLAREVTHRTVHGDVAAHLCRIVLNRLEIRNRVNVLPHEAHVARRISRRHWDGINGGAEQRGSITIDLKRWRR